VRDKCEFEVRICIPTPNERGYAPALDTLIKESQNRSPCVFLQTDNGAEFLNKRVQKVLTQKRGHHSHDV
jgi:hypothetical protein